MGNLFSTSLLVQDNSAASFLQKVEVSCHPGESFFADSEQNILLAGGFTSFFPDSPFPFSPTLQLNCDRGLFSEEQLTRIARAEIGRINDINFHSYMVEADSRVCVIGVDPDAVKKFQDNYGGVLGIEPLLLDGQDPEVPTVIELTLNDHGNDLRLEYSVRMPIRIDLCTYCGSCGPACSEGSISPHLFLDFTTCTLCKECETVCEAGAIDLARTESRVMEVPALILLDGVEDGMMIEGDSVYRENDLKDYFKTLFPCQIDEVVSWDKTICHYSARLGTGCNLCLNSCNYGAVSLGKDGVTVDAARCEGCGSCVAVCPTGALQNEKYDDRSFVVFFQNIDLPANATVVIGDESSLHGLWWQTKGRRYENVFFLEYSPVNSLSLFHFMFLLDRGVSRIILLGAGKHAVEVNRQVSFANSLVASLFSTDERIIFSGVEEVGQILAGKVPESLSDKDGQGSFVNRRRTLSGSLQSLVENSGKAAEVRPGDFISFATLVCDRDRCTQCLACLNDCHIRALGANEAELTLNHIGSMCVACGICVHVCPEDALQLLPHFKLNARFFKPVEMARAEPMACKACGKVFGTRKSFERVMAILGEKETVDTSHFEYCDNCRVVKLFESE
jgi:ferredoxin